MGSLNGISAQLGGDMFHTYKDFLEFNSDLLTQARLVWGPAVPPFELRIGVDSVWAPI